MSDFWGPSLFYEGGGGVLVANWAPQVADLFVLNALACSRYLFYLFWLV